VEPSGVLDQRGTKGVQAAPMTSERRSSAEAESEPRAETRNED
jgi:hypothetical protein